MYTIRIGFLLFLHCLCHIKNTAWSIQSIPVHTVCDVRIQMVMFQVSFKPWLDRISNAILTALIDDPLQCVHSSFVRENSTM